MLFLDIDGVMVPAKSWKSPDFLNDGFPDFSARSTKTLQRIISENITIMLTTSHKANFSILEWKNIFKNRGLNIDDIRTLPENIKNFNRKDEIINWFNLNQVEKDFVIIDDDKSLNDLPVFLKERWVQTSPIVGLTEEHLEAIKAILHLGSQPV